MGEALRIKLLEGTGEPGANGLLEWRGYWIKDQDNIAVRFDDPRLEKSGVVIFKVAGTSYRKQALEDHAFTPGKKLALVLEHSDTVSIWDASQKLQVGYVPRQFSAKLFEQIRSGQDVECISFGEWLKNGRRIGLRVIVGPKSLIA